MKKNALPIKESDSTFVVAVGKVAPFWQWKNDTSPPLCWHELSLP